jgi:aminoglycoside phosphotransferase (APT) family kinase protein
MGEMAETEAPERLRRWCAETLGEELVAVQRLTGGNSNETNLLETSAGKRILRRPPAAAISPSAHSMEREYRILMALAGTAVPAPRPLALCTDVEVVGGPFLVMDFVDGVALLDALPLAYPPGAASVRAVGEALVDALAALHTAPWQEIGLGDFGKPDGFLERQVARWRGQYDRYRVRDIPAFDQVADWLAASLPASFEPGILHGDFHLDNCLVSRTPPARVLAIVDWEMATIGDPLLDLGLALAFWGTERPARPGFPRIQAVSRVAGAPSRQELADRYARASGRSVEHLPYYLALALWKLAAIVEGAYAQLLGGRQDTDYARNLEHDVPALLEEAAGFAGLR